jgi:hypothetical protein
MSIYSHGQFNLIQYPDTSVNLHLKLNVICNPNYFSDQFTIQLDNFTGSADAYLKNVYTDLALIPPSLAEGSGGTPVNG